MPKQVYYKLLETPYSEDTDNASMWKGTYKKVAIGDRIWGKKGTELIFSLSQPQTLLQTPIISHPHKPYADKLANS